VSDQPRTKLTPEQEEALTAWVQDMEDLTESKGKHEGHTLRQAGRCVYCSCGARYQGTL